jgi:uncharacterized protein YfaS (alpha-2-macroglobulin family)
VCSSDLKEREKILKAYHYRPEAFSQLLLQCRQNFPNNSEVNLIWGEGVSSLNGVKTTEDQILPFKARSPFTVRFSCERENPKANCIPILPMHLNFSAPVPWDIAGHIVLKGQGKVYKPSKSSRHSYESDEEEGEGESPLDENYVYSLSFIGPFPENALFSIEIPKDIKDDAGRSLSNIDKYPLAVRTDSYPPLAKFAANFGIIELKGDAALPVTLRNLEPEVKTRMLKADEKKKGIIDKSRETLLEKAIKAGESVSSILPDSMKEKGAEFVEGLKGRLTNLRMDNEKRIIEWYQKVHRAEREHSLLKSENNAKEFSVPKPGGSKAFEVVGIPLKEPGFYIVEMESRILGASLLEAQKPMYVHTAALVTNLSAHFKWGRESSLVWVTTLDKSEPVKDSTVSITDCSGKLIWKGKTNENGIARIKTQLPSDRDLPHCDFTNGLFVFARTSDDMTFTHSRWDDGIEPWRYNLPQSSYNGPVTAHSIFDRSLLRAGETIHMKHIVRKHTMAGFALIDKKKTPDTVLIQHQGSEQRYEFPLIWDSKGISETVWKIPQDAKLGFYEVSFLNKESDRPKIRKAVGGNEEGDEEYFGRGGITSGFFRVEEFRTPLMKAVIQPPKDPLINPTEVEVDLHVAYLSGGGAGLADVKLRSRVQPKYIYFDDYDNFRIANGGVKEGIIKRSSYEEDEEGLRAEKKPKILSSSLTLDKTGSLRTKINDMPALSSPGELLAELEFRDPNGETQTVAQKISLWSSGLLAGLKPDSWSSSKDSFKFHAIILDISGRPVPGRTVKVELFQRKHYSHRKRLVGGFYSYEHVSETKRISSLCEGKSDAKGLLICDVKSPVSGNVILQASVTDDEGNVSLAHHDVWIAGKGEWWFDVHDSDRIDLLPEKKRYEPGETAKFQVRMPFRKATALITVEREGISEIFVRKLSGKEPVIEIPVKGNYAPNIFVSALVVRGRAADLQPTAMIDLGKPAYKLGIAEINVGWKAHELKVKVSSDKAAYKVREKAKIKISVKQANGNPPPKGSEVSVAAVDEGLLELMPNKSWNLLESMMGRRGYEVSTSTAQMQVVGKRHYGLKALPYGGGGGKQPTRELFDTLLRWKSRVALNEKGEAYVEIPLNDSITSFRIAAVASGGRGLFGTGHTSLRTTQDLMILSGLPRLVREGDKFSAGFTIRNTSKRSMDLEITASAGNIGRELDVVNESIPEGEAKDISWDIIVPRGLENLLWEVNAREKNGEAADRLKVKQKVAEAVPVRIFQATLTQIDNSFDMEIEKPADSVSGKGGVNLSFRQKLSNGLGGVIWFMSRYPYSCMEQKVSKAVALRDEALWKKVISELPSHLDSDGLVKYFPLMTQGSDALASYILSISNEAGWTLPAYIKDRMEEGLKGFIEGRVIRYSSLPTADLSIRKVAAMEALSRSGKAEPKLLASINIEPNLWPTSAVIDWTNVLLRIKEISGREKKLREAEQIIRSRLNFQGTTMGFSTEASDNLWWLMVSADVNSVKSILTFLNFENWNQDMPRLVRGALGRQYKGRWSLTTANAWGVLAMEKFSNKFEAAPVTGTTSAMLNEKAKALDWSKPEEKRDIMLGWPKGKEILNITHKGTGKPWMTIQSLAAIPLKEPFSSGYRIKKTLIPIEQKEKGKWSKGDVVRVLLEIEAQADMTWVVVNDPVPAGSSILGTGLGRDSQLLVTGEKKEGWVFPAFEERSFESFRAYYEFVPKGKWTVEYTIRLNNSGTFLLPPTRTEALYSPEMLGEMPNRKIEVGE